MQEFSVDSGEENPSQNPAKKTKKEVPIQQILNYEQFGVEPDGGRKSKSEMKDAGGKSKVLISIVLSIMVLALIAGIVAGYFYMKVKGYL